MAITNWQNNLIKNLMNQQSVKTALSSSIIQQFYYFHWINLPLDSAFGFISIADVLSFFETDYGVPGEHVK